MSQNPAPGYAKKPDHVVAVTPFDGRVVVALGGETIADSSDALAVAESGYNAVYYLPMRDVRMDLAERIDTSTYCPFKGKATYYTFTVGERRAEGAAWVYEAPYDEAMAIKDHLAFYTQRVDSVSVE